MQWRRAVIAIVTIAALYIFITSTTSSSTISLSWRSWLHRFAIMGTYKAPLNLCDGPAEDRVPENYHVFLHVGWSLDQHRDAVGEGTDLDSAIEHIYNETAQHGLYYRAKLNDTLLAAVRADEGVDVVECIIRVPPPDDESVGEEFEIGDL